MGIEPDTSGMLSQNHTPRPTLLVKKGVQESQQMEWLPIAFRGLQDVFLEDM